MMQGSKADLVLSQPNTMDVSYSAVKEEIGAELLAMPEIEAVSGLLQGLVQTESEPFFFVFGYAANSFILERFNAREGYNLFDRIPRDLETICLKCLRKKSSQRYASAAAFAEDLERWLDHRPIFARRVGLVERTWLWCRRRPALMALSLTWSGCKEDPSEEVDAGTETAEGTATEGGTADSGEPACTVEDDQLLWANDGELAAPMLLEDATALGIQVAGSRTDEMGTLTLSFSLRM